MSSNLNTKVLFNNHWDLVSVNHQVLRGFCCFVVRTTLITEHHITLTIAPTGWYLDQCRNPVMHFVNSILQLVPIPVRQSNSNMWWLQYTHQIFIPTLNVHIKKTCYSQKHAMYRRYVAYSLFPYQLMHVERVHQYQPSYR